ncbi:hypothetical protein L208DRAFT_1336185, partial [Tricholoma matsutake]
PLLGAPPIPVLCSIILTLDFPLLEAEVALIPGPSPPLNLLTWQLWAMVGSGNISRMYQKKVYRHTKQCG